MVKNRKVTIKTSARLHFNSLKMNQAGGRGCGGVGVAIEEPSLEMEFSLNSKVVVLGGSEYLAKKTELFAKNILKYLRLNTGVKIEIKNFFQSHNGLGSGTQVGLSVGKGVSMLFGKKLSVKDIAIINKRAGVSGIGYYSFLYGGLIVDGGYRMGINENKKTFSDHAPFPPSLIGRYNFPKKWKILLIIPPKHLVDNNVDEGKLFTENTPTSLNEVGAICTNTLMGLIPSLLERNYFEFINNLFDIIRFGTKKVELELNKKSLLKAMNLLDEIIVYKWKRKRRCEYAFLTSTKSMDIRCCLDPEKRYNVRDNFFRSEDVYFKKKIPFLGVSSLGPAMYSILYEDHHDIKYLLEETQKRLGKEWKVTLTSVRNKAFSCIIVK